MGRPVLIILDIHYEDGQFVSERHCLPLLVGRASECGLRLRNWRIAKKHFLLRRGVDGVYIDDLGSLIGTRVNGHRITRYGPVKSADVCIVGPCKLHITEVPFNAKSSTETATSSLVPENGKSVETGLSQFSGQHSEINQPSPESNPTLIESNDPLSSFQNPNIPAIPHPELNDHNFDTDEMFGWQSQHIEIRQSLHAALIQALDLRRHDVSALSDQALRQEAEKCVAELINNYAEIDTEAKRYELINLVSAEAVGLGVLETLLDDPSISEIMVNKYDLIYVERNGKIERHQAIFSCDMAVRSVIDRIVIPLGRRIDESSPMVDARLKDGSRLNAVIPPVAISGACLTIRKFAKIRLGMNDLVTRGSIDPLMADLLQICIELRLNMIVSGGTGSGKTTLLNILGQGIHPDQRIVTIEDSAELQIQHPHVLSLESRPVNTEGSGQITIRDLVRNAMRMRPDRIIVGEVRGAEALDMLIAMNTGHEGSLTTLHANSPRDALARIETLVLMANVGLPLQAIREQVASAVDIIIQQTRLPCGRRLVTSVAEITGTESGIVQLQILASYDLKTKAFVLNPLPPAFFEQLDNQSDPFVQRWFSKP